MKRNIEIAEFLKLLSEDKIVIYGTGYVALKFYNILKRYHLNKNVYCFVVSSLKAKNTNIEGIPIVSVDLLKGKKDIMVCIAVHEVLVPEIVKELEKVDIVDYIWIYPYIYELLLGVPIKKDILVDLDKIVRNCANDYRFAVRYMVIESYFKNNTIGFEIYKKAQALYSDVDTAEKRLAQFLQLIRQWQKNGYDKKSKIFLNERNEIIDGHHRVALAKYTNLQKVVCDIFPCDISIEELHGEKVMLSRKDLILNVFTAEEIQQLDKINEKILDGK